MLEVFDRREFFWCDRKVRDHSEWPEAMPDVSDRTGAPLLFPNVRWITHDDRRLFPIRPNVRRYAWVWPEVMPEPDFLVGLRSDFELLGRPE